MHRWQRYFQNPIERYARFVTRYPGWIVTVVLALTFTAIFISVQWLHAERSMTALYDADSPGQRQYEQYVAEFGEPDDLIVVVSQGSARERRNFVQKLVRRLDHEPAKRIDHLFFRVPLRSLASLLYATPAELATLQETLQAPHGFVPRLLQARNFEEIFHGLQQEMKQGLATDTTADEAVPFFRSLERFLHSFTRSLQEGDEAPAFWLTQWADTVANQVATVDSEGFLTAEQGELHLLFIKPANVTADAAQLLELVRLARQHIEVVRLDFPGLEVGLTGEPALTHDEFSISERDMLLATIFALLTTVLIFFFAFRSFIRPLLGFSCLIMGVALTFGFVTITLGHLNLFSLTFAVILIGLGTQYGIHIIARYEEERARDTSLLETVRTLFHSTVPSLWIGALTTSAAFYATLLIDFKGFRELAFIAGSGVLICFALMSFVLPAFLVFHEKFGRLLPTRPPFLAVETKTRFGRRLIGTLSRSPKVSLTLGLVLSVVSLLAYILWGPQPSFDYNLLNLQAEGTEAVRYEKRLLETEVSPRFAVFMTPAPEEVEQVTEQLAASPAIGKVLSLIDLLPERGEEKLPVVHEIAATLEDKLLFGNGPSQPARLAQELEQFLVLWNSIEEKLFASGNVAALEAASKAQKEIEMLRTLLQDLEPELLTLRLNRFQEAIATDMRDWIREERERKLITAESLPPRLRERFLSSKGTYAIYAYPAESIWNRTGLSNYVTALREISPQVAGPPLQMYDVLHALASGWYQAAVAAALVIFMIFLYDFRSFMWALVATVPLVCGVTWIYGGMALFGWRWNIVNLIALPLVLGIGADCGIHLIHRFREERQQGISFVLSSTGKAITVAYADTMTSFLGLAVAAHQGLASLGQVIIWGIFCCYIAGIVLLPSLLGVLRPWLQDRPEDVRASR